jgi:heme-degrading monooxygenase HmoA
MFAATPEPPYCAVIFTNVRTDDDPEGYTETLRRMEALAAEQRGYLGIESARGRFGITVSYWATEADAAAWKRVAEHLAAQELGRERWYEHYVTRIALVTRVYEWSRD